MRKNNLQSGFTLIEIAIVLLIIAIVLGYTVAMFPLQQELKQYREVDRELDSIVEHLLGYAQVNGRLPCPDTNGNVNGLGAGVLDGREDIDDDFDNATLAPTTSDTLADSCKSFYGLLPAGTIGITGDLGSNGELLDPWGEPYRYAISEVDASGDNIIDLVSPGEIRDEGLSNVTPDLVICRTSTNPNATGVACPVAGDTIIDNAVAVIYSSGKDRGNASSATNVQNENRDDFHNGTNDLVFTSAARNDNLDPSSVATSPYYDDKVRWISPALLYTRMIEARQLP